MPETVPVATVGGEASEGGAVTTGTVGMIAPIMPGVGATPSVGTAAAELTPRLDISVESSGMPTRGAPPGTIGDAGVEDATVLFDPEPHIPDIPDVSTIPEGADGTEPVEDEPDDIGERVALPAIDAVAGIEDEADVPPPSKVVVEPNIWDDAVPRVEHAVPLPGVAIVPVGLNGSGLVPAEPISVAPSGIPVGETVEPDMLPSGEVVSIDGVGVTMAPI
jgi:hypothetical protein